MKIWDIEIKEAIEKKKEAYLKWLQSSTEENREIYVTKRNAVTYLIRNKKKENWDKFITNIENDLHGRQTVAYKLMKHLKQKEKDTANIKTINNSQWLQYYKTLWTSMNGNEDEMRNREQEERHTEVDNLEIEEVIEALRTSKNRKATGKDGINTELYKYASREMFERILDFMNRCWKNKKTPEEWKTAVILPIFKKGQRNNCDNYRGISLLNTGYKIYSRLLTKRLKEIIEVILSEEQSGFRNGRSCIDNIFSLQQIIEKHREYNRETYMIFIDYEKAFDRVNREKLWSIMRRRGIPEHLVQVIKKLYDKTQICISGDEDILETVDAGLRQGCSLSPILFNLYLDDAIREWKDTIKFYTYNFNSREYIVTLLFADDQVLIASSENELQLATHKLNQVNSKYNMKISINKTKVLAFRGKEPIRCKIAIENKPVEQVSSFKFLGCHMGLHNEDDIKTKTEKFNYINGTIRRTLKNKTRKETMIKFYKVMSVPAITYGSETWIINKSDKRKIQSAEMRFLRSVAGYRLTDRKRNCEIREELKVTELNETIKNYRVQWKDHLDRMNNKRIPKIAYRYRPNGKRGLGRPKSRWKDQE